MTKSAVVSLLLSQANAYTNTYINENCVDLVLGKLCNEQCVGYLVDCVNKCDADNVCISNCAREESKGGVFTSKIRLKWIFRKNGYFDKIMIKNGNFDRLDTSNIMKMWIFRI